MKVTLSNFRFTLRFVGLAVGVSIVFAACSSTSDTRMSTVPASAGENAWAHPAAYGITDTFTFGKSQKIRPANNLRFYFKDCEETDPIGDRAYFSKTAYSCVGPW